MQPVNRPAPSGERADRSPPSRPGDGKASRAWPSPRGEGGRRRMPHEGLLPGWPATPDFSRESARLANLNQKRACLSHYDWAFLEARGRAGLNRLRKNSSALTLPTPPLVRPPLNARLRPPRRSARHPSSSEEGSSWANSPPDSGEVAPWAPGWLSAAGVFPQPVKSRPSKPVVRNSGWVCPTEKLTKFRRRWKLRTSSESCQVIQILKY